MDWLEDSRQALDGALGRGRRAHAYLISGPAGIGKRHLARWLVKRVLGLPAVLDSEAPVSSPDAHHVSPLSGKSRISVEQVRALSEQLALASHQGGAKTALVEPADALTLNAANALLKTLEEPAGDSCIVLIADRLNYLPATILSRCIHVKIPRPDPDVAVVWLAAKRPGQDWRRALALAGGAPLKALQLQADGLIDAAETLERDFSGLLADRTNALRVASGWNKVEHDFVLDWLIQTVDGLIRYRLTGTCGEFVTESFARNVPGDIDTKNLFCYLDRLKWMNSQPKGTYNEQLALEALLLAWTDRLQQADFEAPLMPLAV